MAQASSAKAAAGSGPLLRRPETVARIISAAEKEFAEHGMAGARTDRIARAARVNKALLYYYFKSKNELYVEVVNSLFRGLLTVMDEAFDSEAPYRERIVAFVNGYFRFVSAHPNYPRLVQREMMSPNRDRMVREYRLPAFRKLRQLIDQGIDAGEFHRMDAENAVFSIIGMTVFYFAVAPVLGEMLGKDMLSARAVDARRRAILDFLEHGLFKPPARKQ
ncbi:MAG TPA: TetR/AcrR family transcriptional regulator [Candidatus Acidoferrales bacterium]|nr:TetR/AcrR family transcriptional regulator [Candidatus Acidoferrales bacterium]